MSEELRHAHIEEQMFAWLDGALDGAAAKAMEQHVEECAACTRELEITRRANRLFRSLPVQPLPEGFAARLAARLPAVPDPSAADEAVPAPQPPPAPTVLRLPQREAPRRRPGFGRRRYALAAALVFALVGYLLWAPRPAPEIVSEAVLAYGEDVVVQRELTAAPAVPKHTTGLAVGNAIETRGTHAVVTVGPHSSIRLAPQTRVKVLALARDGEGVLRAKIQLERGSVWVDEGPGVQCAVQTEDALLVPTGTTFDARVTDGGTRVNVWQGTVRFTPGDRSSREAHLVEGQGVDVDRHGSPPRFRVIQPREAQDDAWYQWNRAVRIAPPAAPRARLQRPAVEATAPAPLPWFDRPAPSPSWHETPHPPVRPAYTPPPSRPATWPRPTRRPAAPRTTPPMKPWRPVATPRTRYNTPRPQRTEIPVIRPPSGNHPGFEPAPGSASTPRSTYRPPAGDAPRRETPRWQRRTRERPDWQRRNPDRPHGRRPNWQRRTHQRPRAERPNGQQRRPNWQRRNAERPNVRRPAGGAHRRRWQR